MACTPTGNTYFSVRTRRGFHISEGIINISCSPLQSSGFQTRYSSFHAFKDNSTNKSLQFKYLQLIIFILERVLINQNSIPRYSSIFIDNNTLSFFNVAQTTRFPLKFWFKFILIYALHYWLIFSSKLRTQAFSKPRFLYNGLRLGLRR